ncbi:hypothetical protein N7516_002024 [Penicillium verrucosum]|uniref:uncharacterized protein n=1 Tax=Penicillium verrucosum TaxID=60171 RepID=UPI0025454F43|nr:uncharacterized protein N7516_002024 [Penicillium verrucosum]KAJ5941856.1 hypothetical protein N7516_002024 [Penicillium verrucosum]
MATLGTLAARLRERRRVTKISSLAVTSTAIFLLPVGATSVGVQPPVALNGVLGAGSQLDRVRLRAGNGIGHGNGAKDTGDEDCELSGLHVEEFDSV